MSATLGVDYSEWYELFYCFPPTYLIHAPPVRCQLRCALWTAIGKISTYILSTSFKTNTFHNSYTLILFTQHLVSLSLYLFQYGVSSIIHQFLSHPNMDCCKVTEPVWKHRHSHGHSHLQKRHHKRTLEDQLTSKLAFGHVTRRRTDGLVVRQAHVTSAYLGSRYQAFLPSTSHTKTTLQRPTHPTTNTITTTTENATRTRSQPLIRYHNTNFRTE